MITRFLILLLIATGLHTFATETPKAPLASSTGNYPSMVVGLSGSSVSSGSAAVAGLALTSGSAAVAGAAVDSTARTSAASAFSLATTATNQMAAVWSLVNSGTVNSAVTSGSADSAGGNGMLKYPANPSGSCFNGDLFLNIDGWLGIVYPNTDSIGVSGMLLADNVGNIYSGYPSNSIICDGNGQLYMPNGTDLLTIQEGIVNPAILGGTAGNLFIPASNVIGGSSGTGSSVTSATNQDALMASYSGATGPLSDTARVNSFCAELRSAGLTGSLIDGVLFAAGQNVQSGSTVKTLSGATCQIYGGASIDQNGLAMNGTNQFAQFPIVSQTSAISVVFEWQGPDANAATTPYYFCITASGGQNNGCILSLCNPGAGADVETLQSGTLCASGYYGLYGDYADWGQAMSNLSPFLRTHTVSWANQYQVRPVVYHDGQRPNSDNIFTWIPPDDIIRPVTTPCGVVTIGAKYSGNAYSNFAIGNCRSLLVLSGTLTQTQAQAAEAALRWLYPSDSNVFFVGDSTTCINRDSADVRLKDYVQFLRDAPMFAGKRLYVMANNGNTAGNFSLHTDAVTRRGHGPGGPVRVCECFLRLGINDCSLGVPNYGPTTYGYISTIVKALKGAGCIVHTMTLNDGNFGPPYDSTMGPNIRAFNALLLATPLGDPPLYRGDLILPDHTDAHYFGDPTLSGSLNALHSNAAGNQMWAREILSGGTFGLLLNSGTNRTTMFTSGTQAGF